MAAIDVGPGATDRDAYIAGGYTLIDLANSANNTGKLTSIQIYSESVEMTSVKVATFSGSGTDYTPRDVVSLANVPYGALVTRTVDASSDPISLVVQAGDFLGIYFAEGRLENDESGGSGVYYRVGDQTGGVQTYALATGYSISIYATGATISGTRIPIMMWG